ncbi:hypothetical protein D6D20_07113 [Aureobasidium pullulans]|uniref:Pleckstrin homology domain-containing protein n=1 Tax=Aureobasidium pullulans TaxID=5580 RepID=A0A4S8Z5B8_AURPU|nr:hypothetical protein D6D20_07113 [Aureobasidium pullulans]
MSTDYFQYGALASPARTPEHTPPELSLSKSASRGRKHRDFSTKSAPLPSFDTSETHDANAHAFDANRFTPTLHASLVSEILSLRRELDSKHQFIDNLEESLKTAHTENENLSGQVRESTKKTRQLEQKFKLLENGTFDAVEGLLGERDNVKVANQELRNKLETAGKRAKSLEEENTKTRDAWEKERNSWKNEKRQLEQRVHISETRLRSVVEEVRTQHLASQVQQKSEDTSGDSDVASIRSYRRSRHARNQSSMSTRSLAPSVASGRRPGMTSLANELNSDDEDYDTEDLERDDEDLPLFAENRSSINSRASAISDRKAKKILGLTINNSSDPSTEADGSRAPSTESLRTPSFAERFGLQMAKMNFRSSDASRASSRSTSPARQKDEFASESSKMSAGDQNTEAEAAAVPTQLKPVAQGLQSKLPNLLTSDRLAEAPISPPDTPQYVVHEDARNEPSKKPVYQSASTQTDLAVAGDLASRRSTIMAPIEVLPIPAITIQPPMSPRAGEGVLPPGMRSSAVQTEAAVTTPMLDAGVQTEEIRIDRRPIKLPPHLLPSALENGNDRKCESVAGQEVQPASKHRLIMHRSTFSKDGNRLPLKPIDLPPPRLRSVSRENHQQSEADSLQETPPQWYADTDMNDRLAESSDDMKAIFGNMPGIVRPNVRSLFNGPPKTVPENRAISPANFVLSSERQSAFVHGKRMGSDGSSTQSRPSSSRGTAHSGRAGPFFNSYDRTSSRPNSASSHGVQAPPPPFPIPGRMSSRPPSNDGPRSPTGRDAYSMRSRRSSKDSRIAPDGGLRKVQSSGTMRTNARMSPRRRRRAPHLEPIQSMAFETPSKDNLLLPGIVTPTREDFGVPNEAQYVLDSPDFDQDSAVEEEEEKSQDNVIVDAIAATMVGEWMWKYVRRRRSFGLGESRADQNDEGATSGVRHKRWVWLSPYEHTVMWSSKQPNSGPALLGKAGRKLVIKSVLDVKDTTPLHKSASHEPIFDRSILIITPERALKLTASNRERHYLWLTALSFLAQSGRGPPQVPRISPAPEAAQGHDQKRRSSLMPGYVPPAKPAFGPAPPSVRVEAHQRMGTADSTAPPNISRFGGGRHQRKRSSTNPQFSAASSSNEGSMTASSAFARRASNTATLQPTVNAPARPSLRPSDRKSSIGTVRMDAFISHQGYSVDQTSQARRRGDGSTQDMMAGKGYMFGENLEVDPFEEF